MPELSPDIVQSAEEQERSFGIFHELMARKVRNILLISSLYDCSIMEEDGRLAERIIHEYRGLNLSKPPCITWVSSPEDAFAAMDRNSFDLVITMPRLADRDPTALAREIKRGRPNLPVLLLTHRISLPEGYLPDDTGAPGIDRTFVWSGNTDLLLAMIKSIEDWWNVEHDTLVAGIRVILFVEDTPDYLSSLLPILYREVVSQTQAAIDEGLNEEHRLLTMRSRAKVLVTQTYEEAAQVIERFEPFLLGVISDVRFPRNGRLSDDAGPCLLRLAKGEIPDLPLLLASSDPQNKGKADSLGAVFLDKNSPSLHADIKAFLLDHLGFGDFVFRMPDGREVARASNRRALERALREIPLESFVFHANRNDFSRWLFARSEIFLARRFRVLTGADFKGDMERRRRNLYTSLELQRKWRQKGVLVDFDPVEFDPDAELYKIGRGSMGGKARGLVFFSNLLKRETSFHKKYPGVEIVVPPTLVITTECFDAIVSEGDLEGCAKSDVTDEEVARRFLEAPFPEGIERDLRAFLAATRHPLAVRSSALLEDAQFQAYAGLYKTYMLPNDHPDPDERLKQLIAAIRLVCASTCFSGPKAFARRVGRHTEEEKMAVIVQRLVGQRHGDFFYPPLSGVAQSRNYYPYGRIKPEDGCATIALGLGKTVVEGGTALRFSPRHPHVLPQLYRIEDVLKNSQRLFYAVRMGGGLSPRFDLEDSNLVRRQVAEAVKEPPVIMAAGAYDPEDNRILEAPVELIYPVITFSRVLKHQVFPLCDILCDLLALAEEGMGAPVEIEFALDRLNPGEGKPVFDLLQVRPMTARAQFAEVRITGGDIARAWCYSTQALGNDQRQDITDIVFVIPALFDPARTPDIAREIGEFNARMVLRNRPYVLIGPGRWGSADRWLGIPVTWKDISGVSAIVETPIDASGFDPSQGSHFFHNIATMGINYLTVAGGEDFLRRDWLESLPISSRKEFTAHACLDGPFMLKTDGRRSCGVILPM